MSQDYSEVYLLIKAKLALYHSLVLQSRFNEATDVAIELSDLSIQLEAVTVSNV